MIEATIFATTGLTFAEISAMPGGRVVSAKGSRAELGIGRDTLIKVIHEATDGALGGGSSEAERLAKLRGLGVMFQLNGRMVHAGLRGFRREVYVVTVKDKKGALR